MELQDFSYDYTNLIKQKFSFFVDERFDKLRQ